MRELLDVVAMVIVSLVLMAGGVFLAVLAIHVYANYDSVWAEIGGVTLVGVVILWAIRRASRLC